MVPDSLNFWEFCCLTPTDQFDTYPDLIKIPISIMEEIQLEKKETIDPIRENVITKIIIRMVVQISKSL